MKRKRSRLEIYIQVLKCMKDEPIGLTHLVYGSNLSYKPACEIVSNLMAQDFIVSKKIGRRVFYELTDKARYFLKWCEKPEVKEVLDLCEKDLT